MRKILPFLLCVGLAGAEPMGSAALASRLQQEAVAYAEAQALGLSGNYRITALQEPHVPKLPAGELRLQPSHLSKSEPVGHFFAVFKTYVDGRLYGNVRVDLEGKWAGTLLRTRASLARKTVLTEEHLEEFAFEGQPPPGALTSLPEGFRLKVPLSAGQVLTRKDLETVPLVTIGDRVRLSLVSGDLSISVEATARNHGAKGDRVRLELSPSKRQIMAVVLGPGEARADWADARM